MLKLRYLVYKRHGCPDQSIHDARIQEQMSLGEHIIGAIRWYLVNQKEALLTSEILFMNQWYLYVMN